jgi:DnaJ-domain-containing protein 1
MTRLLAIIIIIVAAYSIFRYLMRMLRQTTNQVDERNGYQYRNTGHATTEEEYREVLGLDTHEGPAAIRKKYKDLLSKYHPDKVQHLGIEFQDMAERKTKEITEAYEFFRKKYNL